MTSPPPNSGGASSAVAKEPDKGLCRFCVPPILMTPVGSHSVLGRYEVTYFHCHQCDLIQTETPYWLDEAYEEALSALDTGAVIRNRQCVRLTWLLARLLGITPNDSCLDYGGAHGLFVREMRDKGLRFRWFDRHGKNLFASGFDGSAQDPHRLVTAFEVWEHLADVGPELEKLFAGKPDFVLIATALHSGYDPDWYYYFPETGQHVAFYSEKSMKHIAERFGYRAVVTANYTFFVKDGVPVPGWKQKLIAKLLGFPYSKISRGLEAVIRRLKPYPCLSWPDHLEVKSRLDLPRQKPSSG